MNKSDTYRIRPAGRHILTIGRDLIQDCYAAVVELVKNAYDADSPDVNIEFRTSNDRAGYSIIISDNGHGMSRDTVINKWMVPSTDDKLRRRISPSGRIMQGRKGVGRYAASILGSDILLETTTYESEKTTVYVEWDSFEHARFLDDVEILIETNDNGQSHGTILTIRGDSQMLAEWNQRQFDKLIFELKKLTSPVTAILGNKEGNDRFQIKLSVKNFPDVNDTDEVIEPYPLFDLFDYRIAGTVDEDGTGVLTSSLQKARNAAEIKIKFNINKPTDCGTLIFDIRVYDREKEAIESLISRGLKDDSGNYVGKLKARQLLNQYNGIGVYRNGFRIRPLGDAAFDWLELNKQRIQNPSLRIGSNQVIGYVQIQSEEQSGLIEKSARDGLKENTAYKNLREITQEIINELEQKRFSYRKKAGLSRSALKVERELEKLFSFDKLKRGIRTKLTKGGVDQQTADEIIDIISKEEEDKNRTAEDIRQTVAVYQGQATLGKIINVILHEGRRPLNYFKNQIPNMRYWYKSFTKTNDFEKLEKVLSITTGLSDNAEIFVKLFGRLDPLAAGKRSAKKNMKLKKEIQDTFAVFETELDKYKIKKVTSGTDNFSFKGWRQDIYSIFINLIDNSVYWISEKKPTKREIIITIETDKNSLLYIDYRDTGPGIEPSLIESEVIFEPQFSTKPEGTGLGLAIAGEAAMRNGLELKALESETGAYFRVQPKMETL